MYNGDTDPRDHLHLFQHAMLFKHAPEETMCKVFPLFLEGKARGWFGKLPPRSINSFEDLAHKFLVRFYQRKKSTKTCADLMNIRQGKDETLQSYVDRFNDESLQVEDPGEQLIVSAFMNGLNPGILYIKLAQKPPTSVRELFKRVEDFQKGQEANRKKRDNDKGDRRNEERSKGATPAKSVHERLNYNRGRKEPRMSNHQLTPLTKPRSEILTLHRDVLRPPPQITSSSRRRNRDL